MVQRLSNDIASQYCERIDGNPSHVRCKFCGHTMWGGITRFRHHLAQTSCDVIPCSKCPPKVAEEMKEKVIHRLLDGGGRKRRRTELSENKTNADAEVHPPPQEGGSRVDVEVEEGALFEQVIQESLKTHEMERKKSKIDEDEFEAACFESMRSYQEELKRRGEGCSRYQGGSSYADDYDSIDFETDSGSDSNF